MANDRKAILNRRKVKVLFVMLGMMVLSFCVSLLVMEFAAP